MTFLIIGLSSNNQKTQILERIEENPDLLNALSFEFGLNYAVGNIAGAMFIILFFVYIYHKAKAWKNPL